MKITGRQVKAFVSIAFFVMLFALVRRGDMVKMLKQVDPLYFVLSFAIAAAQISVSCLKWQVLINLYGTRVSFGLLMKNYLIGYYFTNLLPSNVGGDVVRSYQVGRHVGNQTHAAISVFMERFTGSVYLLLLVILTPLLGGNLYPRLAIVIPALGAAGLLGAFVWIAKMDRPLAQMVDGLVALLEMLRGKGKGGAFGRILDKAEAVCRKILKKAEEIHERLAFTVQYLRKDWKAGAAVVLLTVAFYALTWVNVLWAFRTFGVREVSLLHIVSLLPVAMIVGSIPITLGSLGIVEGSYVFYFSLVGVPPAATLLMGLFLRFKLIVVGVIGFLNYLTYRHEKYDYARLREQA